jgi:WD40 repeat protein
VTAGKDKFVRLFDVTAGKEVRTFGPLADPVTSVTLSRDGALVAATAGKVAKVWNVADGKELASITHPGEAVSAGFSADKTRLVTGTTDNLARVWDLATGRELQSFGHGGAVRGVAFHPTANPPAVVTASADKTAAVHTLGILRVVAASPNPLRALAVTPTGTHVLTAGDDKNVKLWNAASGAEERNFTGATGPVLAVAVSKDGQRVAASGADKTVRVYNVGDANPVGSFPAPGVVRGLAFHPTQPVLAASCEDKSVAAWNVAYQLGQPLPEAFGKPVQKFAHADQATGITFAPDGSAVYTAALDKSAKAWKLSLDTPSKTLQHPNLVDSVAYNNDGTQLATGCHDGIVRIWDMTKPQPAVLKAINAHVTPAPPSAVYAVVWSPDGKQVVSASFDHTLKLWDAASGNMVREFKGYKEKEFEKGHRDQVFCAAFSADGKLLASGSSDRGLKLWTVADGTVAREFVNPPFNKPGPLPQPPQAHPGWVYGLRFTPDGKLVTVGTAPRNQGYLAVWNPADGALLAGMELPLGPIYSAAVSPDGSKLALGCGPKDRAQPVAEAVILKMPGK